MQNKITTIKERVVQIADKQSITKEKFFSSIGMTSANFRGDAQKRPLNSNAIENIITSYPNINLDWLLTGEGSMFKEELARVEQSSEEGIPMIPVEAFAGMGAGSVTITDSDIQDRYVIPDFLDVDFMIRITGASMYPKFISGDIVACRMLVNRSLFQWGRVYVLHHRDQGALVKRLFPGNEPDVIECRSDNVGFPAFQVAIADITNFAIVVGMVRIE